jgi:hypothetical protein
MLILPGVGTKGPPAQRRAPGPWRGRAGSAGPMAETGEQLPQVWYARMPSSGSAPFNPAPWGATPSNPARGENRRAESGQASLARAGLKIEL